MEGLNNDREAGSADVEDRGGDGSMPASGEGRRRKRPSARRRLLGVLAWPLVLLLVVVGGGYAAIEAGYMDAPLKTVALRVLNAAGSDSYDVKLSRIVLRFNASGRLVLEARDVAFAEKTGGPPLLTAQKTRMELDLLSALRGGAAVDDIDVSGVSLDIPGVGEGKRPAFRIDDLPEILDQTFAGVSKIAEAAKSANAQRLTLSELNLTLPALQGRTADVQVEKFNFERSENGDFALSGNVDVAGRVAEINGLAQAGEEGIGAIELAVSGFNISPFLSKWTREGEPHLGLYGVADLSVELKKATAINPLPVMNLSLRLPDTAFYGDGAAALVRRGELNAHYDFAANKIEVDKSVIEFPGSYIPFSGGFIDADRLGREGIENIAVELVIDRAISRTQSMQEPPISFSGKFLGDFDPKALTLVSKNLFVKTTDGVLGGSLALDFGKPVDPRFDGDSPEISLALYADRIKTSTFKQLWPFWLGFEARQWAGQNVFGGTVSDLSLALYLPRGRLPIYPEPIQFEDNELKVDFSMARGRINIAGDIPPLRDTVGTFHFSGRSLDVEVDSGSAYFPSGRVVDLKGGHLSMPDLGDPSLMMNVDMKIAGPADAVAELATYRPIQALERTGYAPKDFSGYVTATLVAHFPLRVSEEQPGEPDWKAQLALDNVAISKPIGGKEVSAIRGELAVNPASAELDADLSVGGVPLQISMIEPLLDNKGIKRKRVLSGVLDQAGLSKLVPGADQLFDGQVKMRVELKDDDRQVVEADLLSAEVSIPWAGWTKGAGVPAGLSFETRQDGADYVVSNLKFSGDGFGVTGSLVSGENGLVSAKLDHVQLAPDDSLALTMRRTRGGYNVSVNGKSADLRGILTKLKNGGTEKQSDTVDVNIDAKLGEAIGFNNEVLKNVELSYASAGGEPALVKLNAVTGGNQAVVIATNNDDANGKTIEVSTTDAGAFARFTGLYTYMYGGLLNQKMRFVRKGEWVGSVDVRRFDLINESRFEELVTTRSGGKSLNEAVRKNIDLKAQHFSRANALLSIRDGVFSISRGVLRGEQVGATFQGIVRDKNGNMAMTGTFMPAYGLNRLFAELPIIGILLGNGRDKGLFGITFKLTGPIQKPKLQINPLSIIAPGVFRSIFEFQ